MSIRSTYIASSKLAGASGKIGVRREEIKDKRRLLGIIYGFVHASMDPGHTLSKCRRNTYIGSIVTGA